MPTQRKLNYIYWPLALLFGITGVVWLYITAPDYRTQDNTPLQITAIQTLQSPTFQADTTSMGIIAAMDSTAFAYSPGWQLNDIGADPQEPADPWTEPSGVVSFTYHGHELALLLATGNYWGYLYVTVDGEPANLLPTIQGNVDSQGVSAGYKTFYEPERVGEFGEPTPRWVRVHRSERSTEPHQVRIEVWRSWGQTPLRAVAIDSLPPVPQPIWPGILLLALCGWSIVFALRTARQPVLPTMTQFASRLVQQLQDILLPKWSRQWAWLIAGAGLTLISIGVVTTQWTICLTGLMLLAYAALHNLTYWTASLLFGLPFYYAYTLPLLPHRSFSLIDIGTLGGICLLCFHWLHQKRHPTLAPSPPNSQFTVLLLLLLTWSFITLFTAQQLDPALREWRTLFLNSTFFALLLYQTLSQKNLQFTIHNSQFTPPQLLTTAWLLGGTTVACIGLWQYFTGAMLIEAEGVHRVRAFYGSPNNLALYLDRTVAVSLALAIFTQAKQSRLLWATLAIPQLIALLFTFSKGGLFLGLPTTFIVLAIGGTYYLHQQSAPYRRLWWLVGIALCTIMLLGPFLSAERFQRLFDFNSGTTSLRLYLWRSSWAMALDHWLMGVGPDNFLYQFRSNYLLPEAWHEPNLNHPHNWILDWWTRLGLPGLGIALLLFGRGFWRLWQNIRYQVDPVYSLGFLTAGCAALAHGLIDLSYALPDLMLVWVFLLMPSTVDQSTIKDG